jgi:hypothetical protein
MHDEDTTIEMKAARIRCEQDLRSMRSSPGDTVIGILPTRITAIFDRGDSARCRRFTVAGFIRYAEAVPGVGGRKLRGLD